MKCTHCKAKLNGEAVVKDDLIFHPACENAFNQALQGRTFKCPKCEGSGCEYNGQFPEVEMVDPTDGYGGFHSPLVPTAKLVHKSKRCDFCDGHGYLATKPKPVVEPARIVGWSK